MEYDISNAKNEIVPIPDYNGYFVDKYGNIYSNKKGYLKRLSYHTDSKGRYLVIRLLNNNGERKTLLVHRIVAMCFIPNPDNLPEVNHKDKNPQNPEAANLEWCTRKDNLLESYDTMSPTRNQNKCELYKSGYLVGEFPNIKAATAYASKFYGSSKSSLEKNLQHKDICIITIGNNRSENKQVDIDRIKPSQNRNPVYLVSNTGDKEGPFTNFVSTARFLSNIIGRPISPKIIQKYYSKNTPCYGYYIIKSKEV